jgi:predicted RNA-binding Zn-ribbon protein involved in translation (DUF1610 family)
MVTIPCPWCLEDEALTFTQLAHADDPFMCPSCGTTVALVEEPVEAADLAA